MKNIITSLSIAIIILASCSPATDKKMNNEDSESANVKQVSAPVQVKKDRQESDIPTDFSSLVPIDVLNIKSTHVYEKYGVEFSGNCYSCDLASLSITKKAIKWTNVCDEKDIFEIHDFSFTDGAENKMVFTTPERTYILTQINKAPVYELVIEGQKLELKNKRVSKYFTTKKALPLFKEHDCGDFEG
ncbi:hypothetical protein [Chryseobacterium gleum]|uniref:hypothetical protein n=1 Tax=Chryseobacterium gleum TaxID=250 RepID=UPI00289E59FD|nr:hypothetical protein [Chryseobacterium gleum]